MSTYTDTTVSVSLATPEDIRELSQKAVHLWVGAISPLWAPFWAAASVGVGLWALGQGAARTLGGTLYDKDLPLALKWPGFEALPKSNEPSRAAFEGTTVIVETAVEAATDAVEKTEAVATETTEAVVHDVQDAQIAIAEAVETAVESVPEIAPVPELLDGTQTAPAEAATDLNDLAISQAAKVSAVSAKKAAEATLDLLDGQSKAQATTPARDSRPLIDPVTEKPVIPAVVEAAAETKLPMPKPAPRRPRKS